jgi:hypothetical protein
MTENQLKALRLLATNPGIHELTRKGHELLNLNIKDLLDLGMVEHATSKKVGYKVTKLGKCSL